MGLFDFFDYADAWGGAGEAAEAAAPVAQSFPSELISEPGTDYLSSFLSSAGNVGRMAGDILSNPKFLSFALPAAAIGGGAILGNRAAQGVRRQFEPTMEERAMTSRLGSQPIDIPTLAAQMTQLLGPDIQETLNQERIRANALNEQSIGRGVPFTSALPEARGRLVAGTNRGIASAIGQAVTGQRGQNINAMVEALMRGNQMRTQGIGPAMQASAQAARTPVDMLALMQMLGGRGGLLA